MNVRLVVACTLMGMCLMMLSHTVSAHLNTNNLLAAPAKADTGSLRPLRQAQGTAQGTTALNDVGRPELTSLTPHSADNPTRLSSTDSGYLSSYLSPETQANHPFTHMLVRWELIPSDTTSTTQHMSPWLLEARVSDDGRIWTAWQEVEEHSEMWQPEDGPNVFWSPILYAGDAATFWQIRATQKEPTDAAMSTLHSINSINVSTVDARLSNFARNASQEASQDAQEETQEEIPDAHTSAIAKPPVISRTAWGCPDGQGTRVSPAYRFATHMIVHHTAGNNALRSGESNWGDRVRAIWAFHTYPNTGRGWGDIGYNYIIAPDGTIYEGRSGGDNAVAFHDTGNYGSMGVSLIGTYSSISPPSAAIDSLVELLAWKANQNDIDPMGSSYYHGCAISRYCFAPGSVVSNIAGHRDVTPTHTSCPGDGTHSRLPDIRNRVNVLVETGGEPQPDNGDLLIDEFESSFTKSEANWYSAGCGYGGHTFYTFATDDAEDSTNTAEWRPTIPEAGRYHIYAHIPQGCGLSDDPPYASTEATYTIHAASGETQHVVDHNTDEEWVDLGTYQFEDGNDGFVTLSDLTSEPYDERRVIFFDSIEWVREEPDVELLDVTYDRDTLHVGELLGVRFTVQNNRTTAIQSQNPQTASSVGSIHDTVDDTNAYVYGQHECFLGDEEQTYPVYPKELERFRVMLGSPVRDIPCAGETGGYPWRWGLNGEMLPGETRVVTGYVYFDTPGAITLEAGMIEEYVKYHSHSMATTTIDVKEEQQAPVVATFDTSLEPLVDVYRVGDVPDNLLLRTDDPLAIGHGLHASSLPWDGSMQVWDIGGPLGLDNGFLLEQTRVISVAVLGDYTFGVAGNGHTWLWVDGQEIVESNKLLTPPQMSPEPTNTLSLESTVYSPPPPVNVLQYVTGTMTLNEGFHVLSYKYFNLIGTASAGYAVQSPTADTFTPVTDGFISGPISSTEIISPVLMLAADDQGGSGIAGMRYSWDGDEWFTEPLQRGPALLRLGPLDIGTHTLYYQAEDEAGNLSDVQNVTVRVSASPDVSDNVRTVFLPLVLR